MSSQLPAPRLTQVYRLEASLGEPLDLGETAQAFAPSRRLAPIVGEAGEDSSVS